MGRLREFFEFNWPAALIALAALFLFLVSTITVLDLRDLKREVKELQEVINGTSGQKGDHEDLLKDDSTGRIGLGIDVRGSNTDL